MGYNLLINGVYWGYNPVTNHWFSSWDIQAMNIQAQQNLEGERLRFPKHSQKYNEK